MAQRTSRELVRKLVQSKIFQDYEKAFTGATGLPMTLKAPDSWEMPHRNRKNENPFCALMAKSSRACAACMEVQEKLMDPKAESCKSTICFAGFCDTSVPVKMGNDLVGFLQTGQVALKPGSRVQFNKLSRQLIDWGVKVDLKQLEEAYFHTRVINTKQYQDVVRLLEVFAQHLSAVANQVLVAQQNEELPAIRKARAFIEEKRTENISLADVARSVNMSTFYFCKLFKKSTGLNFTDYLSRVRIEKSKNLLINPHLRIGEIAYEVGFQSLTHFNRVFRKIVGQSPTDYRRKLKLG